MTFHQRTDGGDPLLGALVRLPADDLVSVSARAGLDFVAVDLVTGPLDEVHFHRVATVASGLGLGVVVLVGEDHSPERVRALGAGRIVTTHELVVVSDEAGARRAIAGGASLVALDVATVVSAAMLSFSAIPSMDFEVESLVLLPGMLGDARVFDGVVAALSDDVRVDARPGRIDVDDSIGGLAASILASAPRRFGVVGHSLGAIVALEVWRRAPERVTRLALLNASARPPSDPQLSVWAELRRRTEAGEFAAVVAEQAVLNMGRSQSPTLLARWGAMAERIGADGFLRQLSAQASRPDSRPSLISVAVPTLVISGSDDTVCPPLLQAELVAGIPGATHLTIEGAGHMSPMDAPSEVAAHLAAWLAS